MEKATIRVPAQLRRLLSDRNGGVAVMTAMSLTTLLGFAGLGSEATLWYVAKRSMQGAADAAAFSAATAEFAGQNSTGFAGAAKGVSAQYGYANGSNGVTITVNNPPRSGSYTSNASAIEVIISQPQEMLFSSLFLTAAPTITTRAVAAPGTAPAGNGCVLALDKGDVTDVSDSGSTQLNLNNCSLDINSTDSTALNISGSASITASSVNIVGNYTKSGTATVTASQGINTGAASTNDPYAGVSVPSYSGCNQTRYTVTSSKSVGPSAPGGTYVFCNGVNISGANGSLNLAPGIYIVNGGNFSISGGGSITGTGVTIVLTGSSSANIGTAQISGSSTVNISAPTSGPTAGMAFFQDRNASSTGASSTDSFSGGSTQNITGALYFPSQQVNYSGGSSTSTASTCTQLIANTLSFSGTSNFSNNCTGTGITPIGTGSGSSASATKLLE